MKSLKHGALASPIAGVAATWSAIAFAVPAPTEDIRDIRPLILFPSWWPWVAVAIAASLLLLATALAIHVWKRRSARPLTPEDQARRALAKAESLARQGRAREWANIVAPTLRTALSARLGQDASPITTSELASAAWVQSPRGVEVDAPRLIDILSTCDLTRFAMARLEADSLVASTQAARDWITRLFAAAKPSPASPPVTP